MAPSGKPAGLLPSDPLMMYYIYVYDYDAQTINATFVICQDDISRKRKALLDPYLFAAEIMRMRLADSISITNGMHPVDAWTEEDLIKNAEEWDVAIIMADQGDKLEALDAAGLLFDFSTDSYFPSRTSIRPFEKYSGNGYCE